MKPDFIAILQKLIAEHGRDVMFDLERCKAFLADYTRNEYAEESRLTLLALESGVQKAIDATDDIVACKKLQAGDDFWKEETAADIFDTLALVLRGNSGSRFKEKVENPIAALLEGAGRIIKGKREFLEMLVAAVLAGGHVLIEDNPGLGKTTVAKTLAKLVEGGDAGLVFKRIQFTPDLLPYDITGVDVFDPKTLEFRFIPGPVLANIVLADEINRATPKVQSALLEVMAERQVTIGQTSHRPPEPFLVIATENPIESEGTFPLPVAQLDRFMMKLSMGYPDRGAELAILDENPAEQGLARLEPVIALSDFMEAKKSAGAVFCHPALKEAIADIVRDTRIHKGFTLGASPRAGLHLLEAAKALALVKGRSYVIDEDLSVLALPVLAHRVRFRNPGAGEKIIRDICLARIGGIDTDAIHAEGVKQ